MTAAETEEVTLDPGESASFKAAFGTDDRDQGEYSVRVSTPDTVEAEFVTVVADPETIDVDVGAVDTPVVVGDNTRVVASVTNDGLVAETEYVECCVDGVPIDDRTVTVGPDAEATAVFTLGTDDLGPGEHDVQVRAGADTDVTTVEAFAPPEFEVETVEVPEEVTRGDPVPIVAEITNTGPVTATKTITVIVDDREVVHRTLTVGPGATRQAVVPWSREGVSPGAYDITVTTGDDTARASVSINRPRR